MMWWQNTVVGFSVLVLTAFSWAAAGAEAAEGTREFGFARVDITPDQPLRLSGYGNRSQPFVGIDEPLWTRAMAIKADHGDLHALVSVESIGFPGTLVKRIAKAVDEQYDIPRSRFVICFTHTHTSPHISGGLTNIFSKPLTREETANSQRYTDKVVGKILSCVGKAIERLEPGKLYHAQGKVTFAENRRVLKDGTWAGFGVNADGPVDHSLPILKIVGTDGSVRGFVFNYACHCTTFDGSHNRINGDWAGYAARYLEEAFPGVCALCTVGCGADANPPRDRNRASEFAKQQGKEISEEVKRLSKSPMQPITQPLSTSFGHADLPFDRPSVDELKQRLESNRIQTRRHAEDMLARYERAGELPAAYPAPIQTWRFGDQLAMVFLSGEVVVDYALRLRRELAPNPVWVSAYANDLFGYLASERVRREGGYEVDASMIYYDQPGPLAKGTEEVVIRTIHELLNR
ncbi:MAG: neutral/alkaline non-lysosomal ceramidase N-terminal domain-containing protein [Planctomycetota bacterium]